MKKTKVDQQFSVLEENPKRWIQNSAGTNSTDGPFYSTVSAVSAVFLFCFSNNQRGDDCNENGLVQNLI